MVTALYLFGGFPLQRFSSLWRFKCITTVLKVLFYTEVLQTEGPLSEVAGVFMVMVILRCSRMLHAFADLNRAKARGRIEVVAIQLKTSAVIGQPMVSTQEARASAQFWDDPMLSAYVAKILSRDAQYMPTPQLPKRMFQCYHCGCYSFHHLSVNYQRHLVLSNNSRFKLHFIKFCQLHFAILFYGLQKITDGLHTIGTNQNKNSEQKGCGCQLQAKFKATSPISGFLCTFWTKVYDNLSVS